MEKEKSIHLRDARKEEAVERLADDIWNVIRLETYPLEHEDWHGGPYTPVSDFVQGNSPVTYRQDWQGLINDKERLKLLPEAIKRVLFDENGVAKKLSPEEAEALQYFFICLGTDAKLVDWQPLTHAIKSALENGVDSMPYSTHKFLLELLIRYLKCEPTAKMFVDNPVDSVMRDEEPLVYLSAALVIGRLDLFEEYLRYFINTYVIKSVKETGGHDSGTVKVVFADRWGSLAKIWEKHKSPETPDYHEFLNMIIGEVPDERTKEILRKYNEEGKAMAPKLKK